MCLSLPGRFQIPQMPKHNKLVSTFDILDPSEGFLLKSVYMYNELGNTNSRPVVKSNLF
jgi:hypothetical protein